MKFLFLLTSLFASFLGDLQVSDDGWYPVKKMETVEPEEVFNEQDGVVWPVFTKQVGKESFLARFPKSPVYRPLSQFEVEVSAEVGKELLQLRVLDLSDLDVLDRRAKEIFTQPETIVVSLKKSSENILDLQYFSQGKWVAERLLVTKEHLYVLQTSGVEPLQGNHQIFIDSLDIEQR